MANILLADDDQMLVDLYQLKFTRAGHKISFAMEANEVLPKFAEIHPDVVLLDRNIGDQDGLLLLAEIRKTEGGKNTPVIILTNMDPTAQDFATVKQYAPAEYIIKEKIELNDLVKKVSDLAAKH